MLKVYVAAASSEMERAEKWMAALREIGIKVTSSWPKVIKEVGSANPMDAPRNDRMVWSAQDLSEVSNSNVFWFLLPEKASAGAYTEFGYAVFMGAAASEARNAGIPGAPIFWIVVSGEEKSIFTALADHFATDDRAFEALQLRHQLIGSVKPAVQLTFDGEFGGTSREGG